MQNGCSTELEICNHQFQPERRELLNSHFVQAAESDKSFVTLLSMLILVNLVVVDSGIFAPIL